MSQAIAAACPPRAAHDLAPWLAAERIEGHLCCRPDRTHPFPPPPSLSRLLSGETEPPLPLLLRRARARVPPHHHTSSPANSYALSPSTHSSCPCPQTHLGKDESPVPPPSDLVGVLPRGGSPWLGLSVLPRRALVGALGPG
jgi:hypothetical protein